MSALAGVWRLDGRPDAEADCRRMLAGQRIYGPHASGAASELGGALALGRNLYRTLPEDSLDRQPLAGARWTLVADVRLDDREALAAAAGLPAPHARELADADIVLAALERWGEDAIERLYGEFALAAFDRERRRLILARDPLGARPLFHHSGDGFFAFASMPKGLHALPDIPRAPDQAFIARAMVLLMAEGPGTAFEGIQRVEPGGIVTLTAAGLSARRWWTPDLTPLRLKTPADYVAAYRAELDRAVQAALRGAGDVAAHLSAGLDSSAVASTAARLLASSGGRVVAYTAAPRAGYDLPTPPGVYADEAPLAARTAALYPNIEHVVVRPGVRSPLAGIDRRLFLSDAPTANLCNAVWLDAINDDARARGLGVLLTGLQGNFTLNYDGAQRLPELLAQGRLVTLLREWRLLKRNGYRSLKGAAAITLGAYAPGRLWNRAMARARGGADMLRHAAVAPERRAALEAEARAIHPDLDYRPWKRAPELRLWALRRVDLGASNKGVLAGWGLDTRDPTGDRRLIEFSLSIPSEQYLRDGVPKALARAALADRLPPEVLAERRLGRQGVDWHEGMTADLAGLQAEIERIGASETAAEIIDVARLRGLASRWPRDGWHRPEVNADYRLALLRAVSAGHFIRRTSGANA